MEHSSGERRGRAAYISLSEMRGLFAALSAEPFSWEESPKIEELETYKTIRNDGRMDIKILSSGGTAKSGIPPKQMCETLARLDPVLRTPRALWEFQFFRRQFDCRVPNFHPRLTLTDILLSVSPDKRGYRANAFHMPAFYSGTHARLEF